MNILEISNLTKKYSSKQPLVLDGVSLCCSAGDIVGLVGHNGAGKSTLLKCILSMHPYNSGSISVCGMDLAKHSTQVKQNIGFVTDNHAVFLRMTGREYLHFMADIYGVKSGRTERIAELDSIFGLGKNLERLIMHYSHGMKQKVCMMGSLMHKPKLWVLDEPMTGLDPTTMEAIKQYIVQYASLGNAVLFSSHDIAVVERLCTKVAVVNSAHITVSAMGVHDED